MPRKEEHPYTTEMLDGVIAQLERAASALTAVRELKEQKEIGTLPIVNHRELIRGLKKIQAFSRAAEDAMDDARLKGTAERE